MQFILASASQRRKEILDIFKIPYIIKTSHVEDRLISGKNPQANAMTSAFLKAKDVEKTIDKNTDYIILAADTIVVIDGAEYGKPHSRQDALATISQLSGKTNQVLTGFAIISKEKSYVDYVKTNVKFKDLTKDEINTYIDTKEPYDKAGSYALQGISCVFIQEIQGDYQNVIGLPISKIYDILLENFGLNLLKMN